MLGIDPWVETVIPGAVVGIADLKYTDLLDRIHNRAIQVSKVNGKALFLVSGRGLHKAFIQALPLGERDTHRCSTCRKFMEEYGGLVAIQNNGELTSVFWPDQASGVYDKAIAVVKALVEDRPVLKPFYTTRAILGRGSDGGYRHFSAPTPSQSQKLKPHQTLATVRQEYELLTAALAKYPQDVLRVAVQVLTAYDFKNPEKFIGNAEWLYKISLATYKNPLASNLIWKMAAEAPAGWCHLGSTVLGSLLDDMVNARYNFNVSSTLEVIKRRFNAKLDPSEYRRPKAPPKSGNIEAAEKLIAELELADALPRRYARLEEVKTIWKSTKNLVEMVPFGAPRAVFAELQPQHYRVASDLQVQLMSWTAFHRKVLPMAEGIVVKVPSGKAPFASLVTATDFSAPPILQWDNPEQRNPVSWYVHIGGSHAEKWGLAASHWRSVSAISLKPNLWNGGFEHHGKGVLLIIQGAREQEPVQVPLFPQFLKAKLHSIRSTIEAYCKSATLTGLAQSSASGLMLNEGSRWEPVILDVCIGKVITRYVIDRWE